MTSSRSNAKSGNVPPAIANGTAVRANRDGVTKEGMTHIRKPMPKKGGNSFYRDNTDYSRFAATLCGAEVTDRDVDYRYAGTKAFSVHGGTCELCKALRAGR